MSVFGYITAKIFRTRRKTIQNFLVLLNLFWFFVLNEETGVLFPISKVITVSYLSVLIVIHSNLPPKRKFYRYFYLSFICTIFPSQSLSFFSIATNSVLSLILIAMKIPPKTVHNPIWIVINWKWICWNIYLNANFPSFFSSFFSFLALFL